MASAKKRLEQLNDHVQDTTTVDVLCTTIAHSPGNNVATIVFSNPSKLNTATTYLLKRLIDVCQELSKDPLLRVVVLTGAAPAGGGKTPAWIGGASAQELFELKSSSDARKYIAPVHEACVALQDIPVPVIARVHGYALGAGLELMTACDLRIATRESKFGMPEAKIGLPSVVEAALFPSHIGMGRTKRLVYLGENLSAAIAEQWGLVERIVDDEKELDQAVTEWTNMIVGMGPKSIRDQKRLMRKWVNSSLEESIQAGVQALEDSFADGGVEPKKFLGPFLGRSSRKS